MSRNADNMRLPLHQIQNTKRRNNESSQFCKTELSSDSSKVAPGKYDESKTLLESNKQRTSSYLKVHREKIHKGNPEFTKNTLFQLTHQETCDTNDNIRKESIIELKKLAGKFSDLHSLTQFERKEYEHEDSVELQQDEGQLKGLQHLSDSQHQTLKSFALLENYLEKFVENKEELDTNEPQINQDYFRQNVKLKRIIIQMKLQMKSKVEESLTIQREEVKQIIDSYQGFIDKLICDKKNLSAQCESMSMTLKLSASESNQEMSVIVTDRLRVSESGEAQALQVEIKQLQVALQLRERNQREHQAQIEKQLEDKYLKEIESLRDLIQQQIQFKTQEFTESIQVKERQISHLIEENQSLCYKIQEIRMQNEKVQKFAESDKDMKMMYDKQIQEMRRQNDQDFTKFEEIVRETLKKKDECIDRLNGIINQTQK